MKGVGEKCVELEGPSSLFTINYRENIRSEIGIKPVFYTTQWDHATYTLSLKKHFTPKKKTLHAHMLTHLCKFNSPNNTIKINNNKTPVHNMVLELCICVVEIFVGCNWCFWGLWLWVCGCTVCCWEKKNLKNELNQRKGRRVCGHTGSAMGTCWWYGGFFKGGELLIRVWLREK